MRGLLQTKIDVEIRIQ